ncbi:hypothetical protein DFH08DRAFT_815979 [Mycena albidolilacea]|uniref:Uncharacterized protein n=1 Tax=Mycena albidolilacea TaxID=1033008 RepID=A0AAD6ZLL1_9AGAR|nr:hypothetical protein DFH08DRAFT_815979 [Mycena albidolilacea]
MGAAIALAYALSTLLRTGIFAFFKSTARSIPATNILVLKSEPPPVINASTPMISRNRQMAHEGFTPHAHPRGGSLPGDGYREYAWQRGTSNIGGLSATEWARLACNFFPWKQWKNTSNESEVDSSDSDAPTAKAMPERALRIACSLTSAIEPAMNGVEKETDTAAPRALWTDWERKSEEEFPVSENNALAHAAHHIVSDQYLAELVSKDETELEAIDRDLDANPETPVLEHMQIAFLLNPAPAKSPAASGIPTILKSDGKGTNSKKQRPKTPQGTVKKQKTGDSGSKDKSRKGAAKPRGKNVAAAKRGEVSWSAQEVGQRLRRSLSENSDLGKKEWYFLIESKSVVLVGEKRTDLRLTSFDSLSPEVMFIDSINYGSKSYANRTMSEKCAKPGKARQGLTVMSFGDFKDRLHFKVSQHDKAL